MQKIVLATSSLFGTLKKDHIMILNPGDLVFTRSAGLLGRMIRKFSQTWGEGLTKVNHTGVIVQKGTLNTALCVEALASVKKHTLSSQYGGKKDEVAVYRWPNLNNEQAALLVEKANSYVGKPYGPGKLFLHFGDWLLGGAYFFRRIGRLDKFPICSYITAMCFNLVGVDFGTSPYESQPDDQWDYVLKDEWECVFPLGRIIKV